MKGKLIGLLVYWLIRLGGLGGLEGLGKLASSTLAFSLQFSAFSVQPSKEIF
jgi:hypothetical protein